MINCNFTTFPGCYALREEKLLWQLMEALSEIKCNVPEGKNRAVTAAKTLHGKHHGLPADEVGQVEP